MLGLTAPQITVLQIVDSAVLRETSTERIGKALDALVEQKQTRPLIELPQARYGHAEGNVGELRR